MQTNKWNLFNETSRRTHPQKNSDEEENLQEIKSRRTSKQEQEETMVHNLLIPHPSNHLFPLSLKANKIKLSYFPIQGVAEKVRLAFVLKGIEFEDDRIPFDVFGSTVKATTKYGQLPLLTLENGQVISQSDGIYYST